jgi:hypothetical protein
MKITVLNDLHLGVNRTGGTTPQSASELRAYTQGSFETLLEDATNVVINGDMFDTYQVPMADLLEAYLTTSKWLSDTGGKLWLIPGNHDLSKNSANLSSFELLARLLEDKYPEQARYCPGAGWIDEASGLYAISHVANQDLFDAALAAIPDGAKTCFLHCNYDNVFAGQSDHSLNLPRATAKELTDRGLTLVLGHEHQGRTTLRDKVIITGNQFPTSVSDCLAHGDAQKDGQKCYLTIDGEDMELVPSWTRRDMLAPFHEVDWLELAQVGDILGFVRVVGADVIKAISKFRQSTLAFVVTNAVKVEMIDGMEDLAESVEDIRNVNVIELLFEQLDPDQQVVVRSLMAGAA